MSIKKRAKKWTMLQSVAECDSLLERLRPLHKQMLRESLLGIPVKFTMDDVMKAINPKRRKRKM